MEADWSVEIGADLPSITVPWSAEGLAFIDLRQALGESSRSSSAQSSMPGLPPVPSESLATQVPEAQQHPALGGALAHLNSAHSQVYTSKCDVWTLTAADLDPLEMESTSTNCASGFASYIDLVRSGEAVFEPFDEQEAWLKRTIQTLRATPATHARADLVLRSANIATTNSDPRDGFAITLYITGCGPNPAAAQANWQHALAQAANVISAPA